MKTLLILTCLLLAGCDDIKDGLPYTMQQKSHSAYDGAEPYYGRGNWAQATDGSQRIRERSTTAEVGRSNARRRHHPPCALRLPQTPVVLSTTPQRSRPRAGS